MFHECVRLKGILLHGHGNIYKVVFIYYKYEGIDSTMECLVGEPTGDKEIHRHGEGDITTDAEGT